MGDGSGGPGSGTRALKPTVACTQTGRTWGVGVGKALVRILLRTTPGGAAAQENAGGAGSVENSALGTPEGLSPWASALGPGGDPWVLGSSPAPGPLQGACFSLGLGLGLSLGVSHEKISKILKKKTKASVGQGRNPSKPRQRSAFRS